MTTFAETDPRLRHLFERIDWAPEPREARLAGVLEHWSGARAGRLFPAAADVGAGFLFLREPGTRTFRLARGGREVAGLLGRIAEGDLLAEAADRRVAVRLQRLFEAVAGKGEPVLAAFSLEAGGRESGIAEILAAPVAEDGRTVDGVFGAATVRPAAGLHPARAAAAPETGPALFALSDGIGERIAAALGLALAPHEERRFEDGEHKARPLVSVRGRDAVVVDSLVAGDGLSPNDRLCRLLFFAATLKDAAARRVIAVLPYLAYARKDRQTKPRDPVTSRYVAQLLEAAGVDRVVTMEAHNPAAFQNAFRRDTDHLDADGAFVRHLAPRLGDGPVAVLSPDLGGAKRADRFRERLEDALGRPVGKGFLEKTRSMGVVSGELFAGEVDGCEVVAIDDLVSSGTTMARAAAAARARGARRVFVAATHGLFTGGAAALWRESAVAGVVVTDTVPTPPLEERLVADRLVVLPVADVFADLLRRDLGLDRG